MDVKLRLQPILTNVIYMIGTFLGLNCLAVSLFLTMWRFTRFIVRRRVGCFIQMFNSWTSNYLQSQYFIFADPKLMSTFRNGAFQSKTRPYVHRASSPLDQRSLTFTSDKLRDERNNISKRKQWILSGEHLRHTKMFPNTDNSLSCC